MFQAGSLKRVSFNYLHFLVQAREDRRTSMFYGIMARTGCVIALKTRLRSIEFFFSQPKEADTGKFFQQDSNSRKFAHS